MEWEEGEIEDVICRRLTRHTDPRGWLAEIFRADEMPPEYRPAMSYVSVTRPGVGRGPHEHEEQADLFAFFGPGTFRVRLWDNRPDSPTYGNVWTAEVGENAPTLLVVPPHVVHGYKNVSPTDAWVVNLPNRLFRGEGRKQAVDEIRYEEDRTHGFEMP
jgi:dTDP-4-dehydrorhamnose 3,5-epimerase